MYLRLVNLTKVFSGHGHEGEVTAVRDVNIDIQRGEFLTLLGPSGCGKTTTLRLIAGFEFPTSGQIILEDKVINNVPPNRREMAMVFQSYALFPHLSVFENVAYGLKVKGLGKDEIRRRVARALELVDLMGMENRAPNQLSGGQQQRVALARALVMEPKVLLLDEPLSNLDAKLREQMRTELRRIQQTLGITAVYVTHDQTEAMTLSDRIVVMNKGQIEQIGTPEDIYMRPASAFVADFIGRTNFLPGQVRAVERDTLVLDVWGKSVQVPQPARSYAPGDKVLLVARPEFVRLSAGEGRFQGIVRRSSYLGSFVEYDVDVHGQNVVVVDADPMRPHIFQEGQQVGVDLLEERIYVLPVESQPN